MARGKYTEAQRAYMQEYEVTRNHLHFDLGWPWHEIPSARSMFEARRRLYLTEPFVRTSSNPFLDRYHAMLFEPERFAGQGATAEIFQTQPRLLSNE